jgi:hypothetical protein
MGEKWDAYRFRVGNPEGKRPLRRPGKRELDKGRNGINEREKWG